MLKHRYSLSLIFFTICFNITCFSQEVFKIIGSVHDSLDKPIAESIIHLIKANNSSLVKVAITEINGSFSFELNTIDTFKILVNIPGYKKKLSDNLFFKENERELIVPAIVLRSSTTNLKEVSIVTKQSFIERKPDRIIVHPDAQISTAGSNAFELLSKAPGVIVNQSGEIKLKGKAGVIVYIDDKPTYLTGSELENFLRSLPTSSIKQIELISNPPAQYEAAGNAGIINFKTKKSKLGGLNGNTSLNYAQGRYARTNNNFNLNYSNSKFSLFSNIGGAVVNHYQDLKINRVYKNADLSTKSIFNQRTYIKVGSQSYNARLGMDYYLTPKTTIGFAAKAVYSPSKVTKDNLAGLFDSTGTMNSNVIANNSDRNTLQNGTFNFNIRHQFDSTGKFLTVDLDYVTYNVQLMQLFNNEVIQSNGDKIYADKQNGNLFSAINIYAFKSDYSRPLKHNDKFDAGIKSSFTQTNNDAKYTITQNNVTQPNYALSNQFLYNEIINAAYVNYSKGLKNLDIQAGLRFESTSLNANQLGNPIKDPSQFNRMYNNLFPTVFLSYKLDSSANHILSANYGKRIDRPFYKDLNPFVSPLDKYTFYAGNPYLYPSIAHNISIAYSYKNLFSLELTHNNVINQVRETIEINNGIYYSRPGNIGSTKQFNLSVQGSIPFTKWFTTNFYSELNYSEYKSKLYTEGLNTNGTYWYININNSINIQRGWSFELSGEYITNVTETQFIIGDFGHLALGIQKRLLKEKAMLKFSLSDVLFTNKIRGTINNLQLTYANWHSQRDTRVASVTFTYRFGKNINKKPRYNSTGSEAEQKRVKT